MFKRWRIMVMSDADKRVRQFSLPKIIFYGTLALLLTSISTIFLTIQAIQGLNNKNDRLSLSLDNAHSTITEQNQELQQYEDDRLAIQNRLNELQTLEKQLVEMIASLDPDRLAAFSDGPKGGKILDKEEQSLIEQATLKEAVNQSYSNLRQEVPKLIEQYQSTINQFEKVKKQLKEVPIFWPADTERITSEFGNRIDPFRKTESFHSGIDLADVWGTEVYATGNGTVEFAGYDGAYGNSIIIDHGNTYKTRYGHLARLKVEEGDQVNQGDLIGLMGSTGRSTGVHLHYEIIQRGKMIDPYPYMTFIQRVLNQ